MQFVVFAKALDACKNWKEEWVLKRRQSTRARRQTETENNGTEITSLPDDHDHQLFVAKP